MNESRQILKMIGDDIKTHEALFESAIANDRWNDCSRYKYAIQLLSDLKECIEVEILEEE